MDDPSPRGAGIDDLTRNGLRVSKVGTTGITLHRPLEEKPKTATILTSGTEKRFLRVPWDWISERLPAPAPEPVGIDVGIKTLGVLSNETASDTSKFFNKSARALARAQRKLDLQAKGSPDPSVTGRGRIFFLLPSKAAEAGREFRKINPACPSQDCSSFGNRQKGPFSEGVFPCPCCGMEQDRDHNASLTTLRRNLPSPGKPPRSPRFIRGDKLPFGVLFLIPG